MKSGTDRRLVGGRATNRGEEAREYVREYRLVSHDEPRIEAFHRNDVGTWTLVEVAGLDGRLPVTSLGIELALREIYAKVEFSPPLAAGS